MRDTQPRRILRIGVSSRNGSGECNRSVFFIKEKNQTYVTARTMAVWVVLLIAFLQSCSAFECVQQQDCPACFTCTSASVCERVQPFTDPHSDCALLCGTETLCGETQHCVLTKPPECECDWVTGMCAAIAAELPHTSKRLSSAHVFAVAFVVAASVLLAVSFVYIVRKHEARLLYNIFSDTS